MTSNTLEEHDLDFDGSVSSVNSDGEKVDSLLIKRILSEMKSEFNRGTGTLEDGNENEDFSEASATNNLEENTILYNQNNEEVDVKKEIVDNNFSAESVPEQILEDDSNLSIITNKKIFNAEVEEEDKEDERELEEKEEEEDDEREEEEKEEQKPRLILTLRTSEGDRELANRTSRRSLVCQAISETGFSVRNDTSVSDKSYIEDKGSMWESRNRRSLRSSSRINNDNEIKNENAGMTRSSRRFSKEHCRESVLQSAIARKEKSFSSLNQVEERSTRRGARSPRQSPNEMKINKPITTRSKSPKGIIQLMDKTLKTETPNDIDITLKQDEVSEADSSITVKTETDVDSTLTKSDQYEFSEDSNDTTNLNSASTNSQTSEPLADFKHVKIDKYYTKTGKRRTKHYKGLKYSLTTGGSVVRKKSLHTSKRGRKKHVTNTNFPPNQHSAEINRKMEPVDTVTNECNNFVTDNEAINNDNEQYNIGEGSIFCTAQSETGSTNSVNLLNNDESSLPPEDVCSSEIPKRKYDLEIDDLDHNKRCRVDATSPCQGDYEAEPDKPEATAVSVGVGSAGLCLCNRKTTIYAKTSSSELYCQAVDSLDGRLIGCCNTVKNDNARLLRPSARIPFLVLCEVHYERLQRHNCCPGCGIFCTQGKFMQCWAYHQYHNDCQLLEEDKKLCPHCGSSEAYEVNISLGAHKYPVLLPIQTPNKKMPSAKMSFTYMASGDEETENLDPPIVLPDTLVLPSGLQITSQGLPTPLDKDKLERLLHVACSVDPVSLPRYTLRNMYQAAKHGEVEKIVHMLAVGLNPNHVFREWGMGSALHAASHGGHLPVVHLLLQAGANTDVLDRDQNTPLMLACANSHNEVVKYLVKAGASVTFKGGDGMTALHLAAKAGNVEACYYLISNPNTPRTFIDSVDDGRWTPLVWAAEHKHHHVVKFLLEKRADPLVRDAEQNIALHWAALSGSIDISEALLNYGSDVNSTNAHADTPLHIAARQNAYECVILLLARGARVDMHNRAGFLPLDCVVGAPNDTYTAIKLNVELRSLSLNVQKRAFKILTNDITRGHESNPIQCVNSVDDEPEPQDYVYVTENCFTSNISVDRTITSLQSCKCRDLCISGGCMCGKISIRCWYDDEGKLLPEFNFADPPMLFECNQACACNRLTCKNRVVQHGITARFQLIRTKGNKGWGVQTLRLIPKGTYVCEYIGEIISDCEADTREDDSYLFDLDNRDGETYCIDARRYGNFARFINHSCMPNLLPVRVFIDHQDLHFPRIAFFANKDIKANEELGFDYGAKFWIIKSKLFTCTCGTENCKYSENTIEETLAIYNKKIQQEEKH